MFLNRATFLLLPREKKLNSGEIPQHKLWWRHYSLLVICNDKISSILLQENDPLSYFWMLSQFDIDSQSILSAVRLSAERRFGLQQHTLRNININIKNCLPSLERWIKLPCRYFFFYVRYSNSTFILIVKSIYTEVFKFFPLFFTVV